jgi:hypothetical protein
MLHPLRPAIVDLLWYFCNSFKDRVDPDWNPSSKCLSPYMRAATLVMVKIARGQLAVGKLVEIGSLYLGCGQLV